MDKTGFVKIDVNINQQFIRQIGGLEDKYVGMDVKINISL